MILLNFDQKEVTMIILMCLLRLCSIWVACFCGRRNAVEEEIRADGQVVSCQVNRPTPIMHLAILHLKVWTQAFLVVRGMSGDP